MKVLSSLVSVVVVLALGQCPSPASASTRSSTPAPLFSPVQGSVEADPVGVWPLNPTPAVVHGFEPPDEQWGSGHRGVDLAGSVGQSVRSALPGKVAFIGHIAGKPVVTISHGDTRTTYEPVESDLDVGDSVTAGQPIGSLVLVFSHCFPQACLHWGWLRGETYLDPLGLVRSTRVRLLPLWRDRPAGQTDSLTSPRWSLAALLGPALLPYAAWSPPLRDSLPGPPAAGRVTPVDAPAGRPVAVGLW